MKSKLEQMGSSVSDGGDKNMCGIVSGIQMCRLKFVFLLGRLLLTLLLSKLRNNAGLWRYCLLACGMENEDGYHVVMLCSKTRALRNVIQKHRVLSYEKALSMTGLDWVLVLLNYVNEDTRRRLMLLWWRAWQIRNDWQATKAKIPSSLNLCTIHR